MKVVIESTDRIGISQEILTLFAQQTWNLKAVEITSCFTYAHLEHEDLSLKDLEQCLDSVQGIIKVARISLMPSEQRENHLQALLDKIPEPIIDVDKQGHILAINQATKVLIAHHQGVSDINQSEQFEYIGKPLTNFLKQLQTSFFTEDASSHAVTINGKGYLADITPVFSPQLNEQKQSVEQVSGAVVVLRTMNTLGRQISLMQSRQQHDFNSIIGQSSEINLIKEQSKRFAELTLPVLINGETGTGKELIARAIHNASVRNKAPFLAVNCAALPEHLLESELFGYASGAFTGAQKGGKPGLIELADGGSLFLDEIAEMSSYLQAKLLRFLEDFNYRRVGGTKELKANVRIISATHQNLAKLITQQKFREDLFYRLNVLSLNLPALRDRASDIPLLADFFIQNAIKQVASSDNNNSVNIELTRDAISLLKKYAWPGNIRQLQNVLFSVVALNQGSKINASQLKVELDKVLQGEQKKAVNVIEEQSWADAQADFERNLLEQLYPLFPTTRKLAERLAVSHNKIAMKLREHQIK